MALEDQRLVIGVVEKWRRQVVIDSIRVAVELQVTKYGCRLRDKKEATEEKLDTCKSASTESVSYGTPLCNDIHHTVANETHTIRS